MHAADLIADFAQRSQLLSLKLSDEGTARLVIDATLTVDLEHDEARGQLHLTTNLGQPPLEEREAFYARVLAANLFGRATAGASLALDPASMEILLVRTLELESTDSTKFETALEALVHAHERLSVEIFGATGRHERTSPTSELEHNVMMRA